MTGPSSPPTDNDIDTKITEWLRSLKVKPENGQAVFVEIYKLLYARLNHDNEKLLDKWDVALLEDIAKNLKYIRTKLKELLDQKKIIEKWGEKWEKLIKDLEIFLEQNHRKILFRTLAELGYLEQEEDKKDGGEKPNKSRLEVHEEQEKLHEKFENYSLEYEHLVDQFSTYISDIEAE